MPYSYASLPSGVSDARLAGKSAFLANNHLTAATEYRWIHGSSWTGDVSASGGNASYAVDFQPGTPSFADDDGGESYSWMARFDTPIAVDTVAFQLTSALSDSATYSVSVANDSSGSPGGWVEIVPSASVGTSTLRRGSFIAVSGTQSKYSGIEWIMFNFSSVATAPRVGQLWAGERAQLNVKPNRPYDSAPVGANYADLQSYGRSVHRNVNSYGFSDRSLSFTLTDSADSLYSIDGLAVAKSVWTDCLYGSRPVLFWDSPLSSASFVCSLFAGQPDFSHVGPYHATPTFNLTEIPPFEATE